MASLKDDSASVAALALLDRSDDSLGTRRRHAIPHEHYTDRDLRIGTTSLDGRHHRARLHGQAQPPEFVRRGVKEPKPYFRIVPQPS